MAKDILTSRQKKFISLLSKDKHVCGAFYLTGGTALAAYYLAHRYSEDLDFFSENEIDVLAIDVFLKSIKKRLGLKKVDFQRSFNRNLFFLHAGPETLKVEFTYFPFPQIEPAKLKDGIHVNSLMDIAVDKAFTIAQNPRARDFIDLYCILREEKHLSFEALIKKAAAKFDHHIDPIQLGTQLLKAKTAKDLPMMITKLDHRQWRAFFAEKAKSLSSRIFK